MKRAIVIVCAVLGAAVFSVVLALVWLTQTELGRTTVIDVALPLVNASLPGKVHVRRVTELGLRRVTLEGVRILDPEGTEVIAAQRVRVDIRLRGLLYQKVQIEAVVLTEGRVDLRELGMERRGLVAAFVDASTPSTNDSESRPWSVRLRRIAVTRTAVRLPALPQIGQLDLTAIALEGGYELRGGESFFHVQRLALAVERERVRIAHVDHLTLSLTDLSKPGSLSMDGAILGSPIALTASGPVPWSDSAASAPLDLKLELRHVDPAVVVAELKEAEALRDVRGPLALTATAKGSARALSTSFDVHTPGGDAHLEAELRDFSRITWAFDTRHFDPARVIAALDGPRRFVVAGKLSGGVDLPASAGGALAVSLDAETQLNGQRLPRIAGRARLVGSQIDDLHVKLDDAHSTIAIDGRLGADQSLRGEIRLKLDARTVRRVLLAAGEAAPDARGVVSGRFALAHSVTTSSISGRLESGELTSGPVALHGLDLRVDLQGRAPALRGDLALQLREGTAFETTLKDLSLSLAGGPDRYTLKTAVTLPERASLEAQLGLSAVSEHGVTLAGWARGKLFGEPWRLDLSPTQLRAAGEVDTEGIALRVASQTLEARGRYAAARADLQLRAHAGDLARGTALLRRVLPDHAAEIPATHGELSVEARLSGRMARPRAAVQLVANGFGVRDYPKLDLTLDADLDAAAGDARLVGKLSTSDASWRRTEKSGAPAAPGEPRGSQSRFELASRFADTGDWMAAWLGGEHKLALSLERLDLDLVGALTGEHLPVRGHVTGSVGADLGKKLHVNSQLRAALRAEANPNELALEHTLVLDDDGLTTKLRANEHGDSVFSVEASLQVPNDRAALLAHAEQPRALATSQRWSVVLDVPARDMRTFPFVSLITPASPPPVRLQMDAAIQHEPESEPSIQFSGRAEELLVPDADSSCKRSALALDLRAAARDGALSGTLRAMLERRALLETEFTARMSFAKLLAGERVSPHDLSLHSQGKDVELASLPVVCRRARGRATFDVALSKLLESNPSAKATLAIQGLSLANETVNLRAALDADSKSAQADLEVLVPGAGKASTLKGRVPLRWSEAKLTLDDTRELAAQLELNALPIAPFLPAALGLSYASGTLSGSTALRGTGAAPNFSGQLEIQNVGFTATALAQPIDHIQGRIRFDGYKIQIEKLTAHDKTGALDLSGDASLKSLKEGSGKLHLKLNGFPVRQNGEVVATVDGDVKAAADVTPDLTHVRIEIEKLDTYLEASSKVGGLPLAPHPDLIVNGVPNRDVEPREASSPESRPVKDSSKARMTKIDVKSSRFWIKRDDFAMRLSADVSIEQKGTSTHVSGLITVERGYIDLLGKVFEIDSNNSTLQFVRTGDRSDPVVAIKARHQNRKTGEMIGVEISGRSTAPKLTFTVDDKKVDAAVAVSAIYGSEQTPTHAEETATIQTQAVLAGLTAGLLATAARRQLGVLAPVLSIDPADEDNGAQVRAGFEFDALVPEPLRDVITGVYVEGIVASDKEATDQGEKQSSGVSAGALLELYFPYNLFTSGQYGPGATWSIDMGWQL